MIDLDFHFRCFTTFGLRQSVRATLKAQRTTRELLQSHLLTTASVQSGSVSRLDLAFWEPRQPFCGNPGPCFADDQGKTPCWELYWTFPSSVYAWVFRSCGCNAVSCDVMPLCHMMSCHIVSSDRVRDMDVVQHRVMLFYIMPCYIIYAMSYAASGCHVICCHVMFCHVMCLCVFSFVFGI